MSSIQPYNHGLTLRAGTRRHLAYIDDTSRVQLAGLEAVTDLQSATVDAVTHVGRRALHDVALLSQVEQSLALAVPHASGRLAAIADLTAIALSEVVADTASKLRRV